MTDAPTATPGQEAAEPAHRVAWSVDPARRLLTIVCRGPVEDRDLLEAIPPIWEHHPEVIGYDTLVDGRSLSAEGSWSWGALREISRRWRQFAGGRDAGRKVAILTSDTWVTMIVRAIEVDYQGRCFRCFDRPDTALAWMAKA